MVIAFCCGVKMNNTTSVETFDPSDLDSHMHVTLSIITGTACPLGVLATLHLILKTIKKSARRLWDNLTLAMEVLCWPLAYTYSYTKSAHPKSGHGPHGGIVCSDAVSEANFPSRTMSGSSFSVSGHRPFRAVQCYV